MSRYIDADALKEKYTMVIKRYSGGIMECPAVLLETIDDAPHIDLDDYVPRDFHDKTCEAMAKVHQEEIADMVSVVRCKNCRKSRIDGKTTHYLWCTEWGRSTDTFGYCERGEREGE